MLARRKRVDKSSGAVLMERLLADAQLHSYAEKHRVSEPLEALVERFATTSTSADKAYTQMRMDLTYREKHDLPSLSAMPAKTVFPGPEAQVCPSIVCRRACILSLTPTIRTRGAGSLRSERVQQPAASRPPRPRLRRPARAVQALRPVPLLGAAEDGQRLRVVPTVQRVADGALLLRARAPGPVDCHRRPRRRRLLAGRLSMKLAPSDAFRCLLICLRICLRLCLRMSADAFRCLPMPSDAFRCLLICLLCLLTCLRVPHRSPR